MRVLLATDGSPHSDAAVAQVATRTWPIGTAVEVLTVVHATIPLFPEPTLLIVAAHVQQTEDLRQRAPEIVLAAADEISRGATGVSVTTKIVEGSPKDVIVEEARDWDADLIVVGSHGYGRLKRMVLGSVAAAVVANAPCSVEVVRPKHLLQQTESVT
jgi:nucleotide-binding universal stress UspA family protein